MKTRPDSVSEQAPYFRGSCELFGDTGGSYGFALVRSVANKAGIATHVPFFAGAFVHEPIAVPAYQDAIAVFGPKCFLSLCL